MLFVQGGATGDSPASQVMAKIYAHPGFVWESGFIAHTAPSREYRGCTEAEFLHNYGFGANSEGRFRVRVIDVAPGVVEFVAEFGEEVYRTFAPASTAAEIAFVAERCIAVMVEEWVSR